jgi:hypothetical protein
MAKDPLDLGTGINVADGVERGIAPFPTNQMFVDWANTTAINDIHHLLDGDNATTLVLADDTAYYLKLNTIMYANNITIRLASTVGVARTVQAWYSADTTTYAPTTWSSLANGVYIVGDTPGYAYRCGPVSGTAPFAVCWVKFMIAYGGTEREEV